ncbi:MAG: serine hydrolase [Lachnospiraceae bacterium]|nr:serine hydrolase [Lachnospiraceae bacterium]
MKAGYETMSQQERAEEKKRALRRERIARMRRERARRERIKKLIAFGIPVLAAVVILIIALTEMNGVGIFTRAAKKRQEKWAEQDAHEAMMAEIRNLPTAAGFDVTTMKVMADEENAPFLAPGQPEAALLADVGQKAEIRKMEEEATSGILGGSGQMGGQLSPFMTGYESSADAFEAHKTSQTTGFSSEVVSDYGVLMDAETGEIKAARNATTRISPASMTKVLTVLVAAENLPDPDLEKKVPITIEVTDFSYRNDCSAVGFSVGEEPTVKDLFYGTILPSGGDAAYALACYVAGSMETFADLMNEKLKELGISGSAHFTNCVGLYDEEHYCTIYDMALIMDAAMRNDFVREVLSAHSYTTSSTPEHPEGIIISNWFLRRIEDKDCGGLVVGAKTGFVVQSRNCAVSYATDANGHPFICATGASSSSWRCIYDHVEIYKAFFNGTGFDPATIAESGRKPEDEEEASDEAVD